MFGNTETPHFDNQQSQLANFRWFLRLVNGLREATRVIGREVSVEPVAESQGRADDEADGQAEAVNGYEAG